MIPIVDTAVEWTLFSFLNVFFVNKQYAGLNLTDSN